MRAIIFDMDGVLVLTEHMHYSLYKEVLKHSGFSLTLSEYNTYFAGKRTKEALEGYLHKKKHSVESVDLLVNKFRALKREILHTQLRHYVELRKGTVSLLAGLKKRYILALATSTIKEFTEILLTAFDIKKYFTVLVYAEDVVSGKPSPEVYRTAAKRLGIPPSDCIVIEDAENGILAAKHAGMICVAVQDSQQNLTAADYVVKDFSALNQLLLKQLLHPV